METKVFASIDDYRNEVVNAISITSPEFYNHFKVVALDYSKDVILFLDAKATGPSNTIGIASLETLVETCSYFTDGLPNQEQVDSIHSEKTKTLIGKLMNQIHKNSTTSVDL